MERNNQLDLEAMKRELECSSAPAIGQNTQMSNTTQVGISSAHKRNHVQQSPKNRDHGRLGDILGQTERFFAFSALMGQRHRSQVEEIARVRQGTREYEKLLNAARQREQDVAMKMAELSRKNDGLERELFAARKAILQEKEGYLKERGVMTSTFAEQAEVCKKQRTELDELRSVNRKLQERVQTLTRQTTGCRTDEDWGKMAIRLKELEEDNLDMKQKQLEVTVERQRSRSAHGGMENVLPSTPVCYPEVNIEQKIMVERLGAERDKFKSWVQQLVSELEVARSNCSCVGTAPVSG